ncbi:DUF4007 family protein [Alkalimarinus alittae]|uniref:DUF4007 family protein n=1 Tax=Alkalimarinus alittae TaxID=2961619 RepID=A0ABY6N3X3_9ALTE|nr:DUF4007 family protein [Alkalimarinus alittae]UZE96818.1 DUF4007 family protein [Alkalimarinus alittae]
MKAKFSGHDTFPLRYGWLFKATKHLSMGGSFQTSNEDKTREAIVELGVGKNMVNAIRYWAESSSIFDTSVKANIVTHSVSEEAKLIFGDNTNEGLDPYLENAASIWLIHFWLNFNIESLTAYRYFFNYSNVQYFEKATFLDICITDTQQLTSSESPNDKTIKKDIDCFLNTYSKKAVKAGASAKTNEDSFASPLVELGLIQELGGGYFSSPLDLRADLPINIFIYSVLRFSEMELAHSGASSMDFDTLLTKPYSPGRIFRLSEKGLGQKLDEAQRRTNGDISWVDSLGLRQVQVKSALQGQATTFIEEHYRA